MSNIYFVTLSYLPVDAPAYHPHLRKIISDAKNTKVLICEQYGTTNHLHYHLLVETDTPVIQKFRMRFRTYMKPMKPNSVNLDIQTALKPGVYLNYFKRDSTSKITNVASKPFDMAVLQEEAIATPDPGPPVPSLSWSQVYTKLTAVGWSYPSRPGEFLRKLEKHYDIMHIVCNPKKLSLILRYYGSKNAQDWDDVFIHQDNQNKGF